MNKRIKSFAIIFAFTIIFSVVGIIFWKLNEQPKLTEEEVKKRVENVYSGQVSNLVEKEHGYDITFKKDSEIYEVFINKINGKFSDLTLIEGNQVAQKSEENDKELAPSEEKNKVEQHVILKEDQVISIVLKELSGEIDDVDYVSGPDGGYYLVEIENETEEVEFQIHAVTGKILSVKFDD